jgi:hypothetical protein
MSVNRAILKERKKELDCSQNVFVRIGLTFNFFPDTLNLRGSDIEFNPVFFSYLVITPSSVVIFWGDGQLPEEVMKQFLAEEVNGVEGKAYGDIVEYLHNHAVSQT